jgi:hypothetical protein
MKRVQTGSIMIYISVTKFHHGEMFCKAGGVTVGVLANLITEMRYNLFFILLLRKYFDLSVGIEIH